MKDAANLALLSLSVLVTCFTLLYLVRSPWWRNRVGVIYAAKSTILSAVLIQITLSSLISTEYPGRQPIRLAIYTLGALAYLPMIWSLAREQTQDRRRWAAEEARKSESKVSLVKTAAAKPNPTKEA
ncbi:putative phage holin [Rhodococcus erythropolis]